MFIRRQFKPVGRPDSSFLFLHVGDSIERKWAKMLDEGHFKPFPTSVVKRDITGLLTGLGLKTSNDPSVPVDFVVMDEGENGSPDAFNDMNIVLVELDVDLWNDKLETSLDSRLRRDGWYIGNVVFNDDGTVVACEPRFPVENDRVDEFSRAVISQYRVFYHNTLRKYADKIFRDGLLPSVGSREDFKHPERIYLFGRRDMAFDFSGITEGRTMVPESERTSLHNLKKYVPRNELDRIVLKVDLEACLRSGKLVRLYHDNRWNENDPAFFTCNTIPPKFLTVEEI